MNKIKGSTGAKIAAWIGLVLSGFFFIGSILGIYAIQDMGVYRESEEDIRKQAYEAVAGQYAVMALENMGTGKNKRFDDTYFRYGIIEAEDIDKKDLNLDSSYVERNFKDPVDLEQTYLAEYQIGENTLFAYAGTLFGGYGVYDDAPDYTSLNVESVCYDKEKGIFYYKCGNTYYPAQSVELQLNIGDGMDTASEVYEFYYDFEKGMYSNYAGYLDETETGDDAGSIEDVLKQNYITFSMFDHTGQDYRQWENITLNDVVFTNNGDIKYVEGIPASRVTPKTDYYLLDGNPPFLHVRDDAVAKKTYTVLCILPEDVKTGFSSDLFVQANTLVTMAYAMRYTGIAIPFVAFFTGIFCFVFLIRAAGHRKGTDEIVETWVDKIPFDVFCAGVFILELMLCMFAVGGFGSVAPVVMVVIAVCAFLIMCAVLMFAILGFAVRIKKKTLWKGTVIYRIFSWFGRGIRLFSENVSILSGSALIIGGLCFLEFIGILMLRYHTGLLLLCWMVEKAVMIPVIFAGVIQMKQLLDGSKKIAEGDLKYQIATEKMFWKFKEHAENLNNINVGMSRAVDERMKSERFKTELITNVSHDIKTPLTSIINYVDLLEKEDLQNEAAREYLEVLDRQSGRLKKLIEDLMEASKASTGSLPVQLEKLEAGVFLTQTIGEFKEKTEKLGLELLIRKPEQPVFIMADGRHFWRVIDNLMNNICKYAQPSTRVYIDLEAKKHRVSLIFRNTSKYSLNITSEELMDRFVRGDSSRNTEGSGLGLSIAKSLMELMRGTFTLHVDGDLFKVVLEFAEVE